MSSPVTTIGFKPIENAAAQKPTIEHQSPLQHIQSSSSASSSGTSSPRANAASSPDLNSPAVTTHLSAVQDDSPVQLRQKKTSPIARPVAQVVESPSSDEEEAVLKTIEETITAITNKFNKANQQLQPVLDLALKAGNTKLADKTASEMSQRTQEFNQKIESLTRKQLQIMSQSSAAERMSPQQQLSRATELLDMLYSKIAGDRSKASDDNEIRQFYRSSGEDKVKPALNGFLTIQATQADTTFATLTNLDGKDGLSRAHEVAVKTIIEQLDLLGPIKEKLLALNMDSPDYQQQINQLLESLPPKNKEILQNFIAHLHQIFPSTTGFNNASVTLGPCVLAAKDNLTAMQYIQKIGPAILGSAVLAGGISRSSPVRENTPPVATAAPESPLLDPKKAAAIAKLESDKQQAIQSYETQITAAQHGIDQHKSHGDSAESLEQAISKLKTLQQQENTGNKTKKDMDDFAFKLKAENSKATPNKTTITDLESQLASAKSKYLKSSTGQRETEIKMLEGKLSAVQALQQKIAQLTAEKEKHATAFDKMLKATLNQ